MPGRVRFAPSREAGLEGSSGFFREENLVVLEAPSILCAVRYAESRHPPGRLLTLSDNSCAGVGALQRTLIFVQCFQSCVESLRLASGQVLSYRSGGHRQS